jgi:hypothetical protein
MKRERDIWSIREVFQLFVSNELQLPRVQYKVKSCLGYTIFIQNILLFMWWIFEDTQSELISCSVKCDIDEWMWMVSFTPWRLVPKESAAGTTEYVGWVSTRTGLDVLPVPIITSETSMAQTVTYSLYRLHYSGSPQSGSFYNFLPALLLPSSLFQNKY